MKKTIACITAVLVISTAAFSKNFFTQRFFEVKTGVDFGVSNNLFAANQYMKKDLVIDLRKIADECPANGFNIRADIAPLYAMNVNVGDIHVGVASGVEMYESMALSKDLFDFLGYGNKIGETMNFSIQNDTDVFAFSQLDVGFKLGKLRITAKPALFLPILSMREGGGSVTLLNDSEGNVNAAINLNVDVYSAVELKKVEDGSGVSFDQEKIESALYRGYGFDLGGGVGLDLTKSLAVDATCRIPIIPGHLNYKANVQGGYDFKMKITDFENPEKTERETTVTNLEETLSICRPLKLDAYVSKSLLAGLFNARAGAGFGIRRPFSDAAVFYPEYYLGFGLNLIDMIKVGVSTEYRDQLFIHQVGTTLNIRLIQIDLGLSSQSTNFKKSLSVAGVGAYAYLTLGF